MTGIKERHWADDDQDTSDLAYEASVKAIADAGIQPEDIDHNCCHSNWRYAISNCRKYVARTFRDGTGLNDQLAACSGFMYSMITAKQYVQSGDYHNILVVGADKLSKITDLTDRSTAVLFGDGAVWLSSVKFQKAEVL